jgi:hypothetical protein
MNDIQLNDSMDLLIQSGDFVIADAEQQIQQLILIATQGSFRGSPLTGVNVMQYLKSMFTPAQVDALKQKIKLQFQFDGYNYVSPTIDQDFNIDIAASR